MLLTLKNLFFVKAITKYGVFNNYMISSLSGPNGNLLKMNEGGGRSEGGGSDFFHKKGGVGKIGFILKKTGGITYFHTK